MVREYIMAVTNDEYELPLTPPMRAAELAVLLGLHISAFNHWMKYNANHKRQRNSARKYVKVQLDDEDE